MSKPTIEQTQSRGRTEVKFFGLNRSIAKAGLDPVGTSLYCFLIKSAIVRRNTFRAAMAIVIVSWKVDSDMHQRPMWRKSSEGSKSDYSKKIEADMEADQGTPFDQTCLMMWPSGTFLTRWLEDVEAQVWREDTPARTTMMKRGRKKTPLFPQPGHGRLIQC